jgi:hypothetical protein
MSLVTLIRDYVDVANSSEQLNGYTFSSLAYYTLGFLFSILKQVIVNFCTFQWIRDFSYFCLTPPMLFSSFANINLSEGFINAVDRLPSNATLILPLRGQELEPQSLSNLVAFSETNFLNGIGLVLLGFFNGCFTSVHISAVNLVTIQRLFVQGVPAGLCSALGTAIGQCFFLACVHFGFRTFLFPWLSVEPLPFLLGIGILLAIASNSAQDRRTPTVQWSAKSLLLTYTFTSVALAWCEQTALFQLMGNLSFGAEPTLLETAPSFETIETIFGNIQQIVKNGSYLLAFFLGNFLGTFFLAYALQRLLELLLSFKEIPIYYGLIKQANLPLATLIFAFGFGSLPYYGFDYLITKGVGFIPQEQLFQQTLFSPVNLVSKTSQTKESTQGRLEDQLALLFTLEGEKNKSFVVDTTPFDDGHYLKAGQKRPQTFEDLNYRGEHLWTNRLSRISNIREQANQTQSSFLGPVFSWMRSFFWGEGPITNTKNSINSVNNKPLLTQSDSGEDLNSSPIFASPEGDSFHPSSASSEAKHVRSSKDSNNRKKELSDEGKQLDNYVKEFDRQFDKGFSNYHHAEPLSLMEIEDQWQEQRIKKKCYTNPIYTFLLNREIDSFLGRQPNSHRLSAEEEILLLKRRKLLSNYYDSLTLTSQVPTSQAFNQLVPKSYTNGIYNHQFKGTLKVARRLFSIKNVLPDSNSLLADREGARPLRGKDSLESETAQIKEELNPQKRTERLHSSHPSSASSEAKHVRGSATDPAVRSSALLIKEDQTIQGKELREKSAGASVSEMQTDSLSSPLPFQRFASTGLAKEQNKIEKQRTLKFDQPLFSKEKILPSSVQRYANQLQKEKFKGPAKQKSEMNARFAEQQESEQRKILFHEELKPKNETILKDKNVFLLKQAESLPLYASWDEELRKLILTNRFQSRIKAGYTYSTEQDFPKTVQSQVLRGTELDSNGQEQEKDSHFDRSLLTNVSFTAWPLPNPLFLRSQSTPLLAQRERVRRSAMNVASLPETLEKKHFFNEIFEKHPNSFNSKNQFLFPTPSLKEPATNDMVNALLQWQKLIKDNKQLSKEDKQAAKEKVSYWPKNLRRANWSTELMDNDIDFDEPAESGLKKQTMLWEFIPPNYGGFIWPGIK